MIRALSMSWFHVRLFARNTFFVQLLLSSTLSILALQVLALRGTPGSDGHDIWLRAGMVGAWTVCTVAAGIISFQRFQGTLVHLVLSPSAPSMVLMPVIASASIFGLAAFPLAALGSLVAGVTPGFPDWKTLTVGVLVYWLACLSISSVVAALFVLTPNAFTYEGLLAVPLILLSGVFGALPLPGWLSWLTWLLPTTPAVAFLNGTATWAASLVTLAVATAWFLVAHRALAIADRRARVDGTLALV